MAQDAVKSTSITNLDATPIEQNPVGFGGAGRIVSVGDFCAATAAGLGSAGSYYKLCRIPTNAVIQSVRVSTDKAPDTASSPVVAFDANFIFSDAAEPSGDGTPASLQGLIPTSANTGGTTTIASYSSPNKMLGTIVPTSHTAGYGPTDVVFNGIGTTYNFSGLVQMPLWQTFGFTNAVGSPADPGGYFDLMLYVSTAAGTGQACNIYARIDYII